VKFLAERDLEKVMKKIKKSTSIALATAVLFFSIAALSFPLVSGEVRNQLCSKMDTFVSTWIEVAGAFAFSQGPINVAELAFLNKNDCILESEVGSETGSEIAFASESEFAPSEHHSISDRLTQTDLARNGELRSMTDMPRRVRRVLAHSKSKCGITLPISTVAIVDILRSDALARNEAVYAFSEERTRYIVSRVEAMKVARAFENVRAILARRAAAVRFESPARTALRPVVLNESKRRLCPQENSDTITTNPETSF